jgi:hypothetical protein
VRYNIFFVLHSEHLVPISLRLPAEIESHIAQFSARQGMSKSAVIVRSIHEFLARNAQPSALQIYETVMREDTDQRTAAQRDSKRESKEHRPNKISARDVIRQKHATRSERAMLATVATQSEGQ